MSGNCIGERTGAKLSCKLAYSREGIPKIPFMPTVVVILEMWPETPILPKPSFSKVDYRCNSGHLKRITYTTMLFKTRIRLLGVA